jgi:CheY-like chemotaxis protein
VHLTFSPVFVQESASLRPSREFGNSEPADSSIFDILFILYKVYCFSMTNLKKTILIIEDEEPMQIALEDILKFEGFNVLKAVNGEEGLSTALREHPDLILLDILMPQMNGLVMLKKLRTDDWGKNAKVIVLTNYDEKEYVATALENEAYDYFIKTDIKITEVIQKIKEKLEV